MLVNVFCLTCAVYAVVCFLSVFFYLLTRTENKSLNVLLSNIWYFLVAFIMDFLFFLVSLVEPRSEKTGLWGFSTWSHTNRAVQP